MTKVLFDIVQDYYWPAMEPIYRSMAEDSRFELSLRIGPNQKRFLGVFLFSQRGTLEEKYRRSGFTVTRETRGFDAVIVGDTVRNPEIYGNTYLCNVDHGPCFKTLRYRNLLRRPDVPYVVFAEGPYRVKKLREYGLDKTQIIYDVGLPKLDIFFDGTLSRKTIVERHGLDPAKRTILYAPTYKPTSLFDVGPALPALLDEYNVVVKLHPYSWSGKYAPHSQHRLFERLAAEHPKLCLVSPEHHDILPYLFAADVMISEASSVINEFLALGRCGIIYDLPDDKLRHSDGEPLLAEKTHEWLSESFVHIDRPASLAGAVEEAMNLSQARREALARDKAFMYSATDGKSAMRVRQVISELVALPARREPGIYPCPGAET